MAEIVLEPYVAGDAAVLCEVDADPEHRRRFEFPPDFAPSLQHSRDVIARWEAERLAGTRFPYAVRNPLGELLGGCELCPAGGATANVSFWTHPRHRRQGVAAEAVRLAIELAPGLGFDHLEVVAEADNIASRRVALRNGFRECAMRGSRVLYVLDLRSGA